MIILLDTQVLLWAASAPQRLSDEARDMIRHPGNEPVFSAASLWEIAIKHGLQRKDFAVDPHLLRSALLKNGYRELPVSSAHAVAVTHLPLIHRDPFDRILVAQAQTERMTLLTTDAKLGSYPGPIRVLG